MTVEFSRIIARGFHSLSLKESQAWEEQRYGLAITRGIAIRVLSAAYLPFQAVRVFFLPVEVAITLGFCLFDGVFVHRVSHKSLYIINYLKSIPLTLLYTMLSAIRNVGGVFIPEVFWRNDELYHRFSKRAMQIEFLHETHFVVRQSHWNMERWFNQQRVQTNQFLEQHELHRFARLHQSKEELFQEVLPKMERSIVALNKMYTDLDVKVICLAAFYLHVMQKAFSNIAMDSVDQHIEAIRECLGLTAEGKISFTENTAFLIAKRQFLVFINICIRELEQARQQQRRV